MTKIERLHQVSVKKNKKQKLCMNLKSSDHLLWKSDQHFLCNLYQFQSSATLYEKNLIHKQNFVLLLSYTYFYLIIGYFQWYHFFCFFNHKSWLTFPNPRTFKFFNPDVVMKFYQISLSNFIIMEIFLMILLSFMESYMKFWKISHSFCLVAEEFE